MIKNYRFHFRLGFTVFWLFFFSLFCVLGVWQLHRYDYKKNLLTLYQDRLLAEPKNLSDALKEKDLTFQAVKVTGVYLNDQTMFVQNQMMNEKMGFEVLTPLKIAGDNKLILVDRGFIEKPVNQALPTLSAVQGTKSIAGHIKLINEYQFILGANILAPHTKPIVMQKIDLAEISRVTNLIFYPFVLRLDVHEPNGFARDWTITNVMPERHMGYAVQWFVMAFVLFIAFFCFCAERVTPGREINHEK